MIEKGLIKCCVIILFSISILTIGQAQEETTAGVYNEGLTMLKAKEYETGLAQMEKALELATADENEQIIGLAKKNGAIAAYNVGNAKRKAKAYDEAIAIYQKGIEMSPKYSSNYEGIGRAQEAKGEKVEALKSYLLAANKATEEGSAKKASSRLKKAEVLVGKTYVAKDYAKAVEMGKAYTESKPDNAEVHYYLSRSYAELEQLDDAITSMTKAIELSGADVDDKYNFYLGEQYENNGNGSAAISAYKKVSDTKYKAQADYRVTKLEGK